MVYPARRPWPAFAETCLRNTLSSCEAGRWHSAQTIAASLSDQLGRRVTRNMVIGKIYRLGLHLPDVKGVPQPQRAPFQRKHRAAAPSRPKPQLDARFKPDPCTLLLLDSSRCHWPLGDPRSSAFLYCGAPVHAGCYCAYHDVVAFDRNKSSGRYAYREGRDGRWR